MWDERYSVDDYVYGRAPNDFLLEKTAELQEGRALCLAEGEGRNAVHLARRGFSVTAVDRSSVGLAKAERLAGEYGTTIETIVVDLADYTIEETAWDTIVSISCHVHPDLRKRLHREVVSGLRVGGTFLLEAYTPHQLDFGTGGPRSAELMMDLDSLRRELDGLEFIHSKELVRDVREGVYHTGASAVVQVLARKPGVP